MTKSLFATLAVTALAAMPVLAQASGQIQAKIPFDFTAGKTALPAGEYFVQMSHDPATIWVRSAETNRKLAVLSQSSIPGRGSDSARLVFHVYGDRYFLWEAYTSGHETGVEIPRSHEEQELIAARHATKTITIVASLH
jgi:hypothetical protein